MPLLVLILVALTAGAAAALVSRQLQRRHPVTEAADEVRRAIDRRPGIRGLLDARHHRSTVAGLVLMVALTVFVTAGVALGALVLVVRAQASVDGLDVRINGWAHDHATTFSTDGLDAVTQLGATSTVVVLALVLASMEAARPRRARWSVPFLLAVLAGELLLSTTIKALMDRARPTLNPVAATLGPSFPSGHTTAAAAFYAAAAFLLARGRGPRAVPILAGVAAAIAVAVAASRVLLGVHWFTDTLGGLALGWGWAAVCAIIFAGRLLRADVPASARAPSSAGLPRASEGRRAQVR